MESRAPSLRRCRPPDARRCAPQKSDALRLPEARIAALHVVDEAGIESQLSRFGCAADALHIAAGIRAVARAERFGVVPAINPRRSFACAKQYIDGHLRLRFSCRLRIRRIPLARRSGRNRLRLEQFNLALHEPTPIASRCSCEKFSSASSQAARGVSVRRAPKMM